jgi:glutathione S-transferase
VDKPTALGCGSYDDVVRALEMALTPGPYILGGLCSAVDVYLGSQVMFGLRTKSLEPRPIFLSYVALLAQRPAYKRCNDKAIS